MYRKFRGWLTASYWHFQLFFAAFGAILVFFMWWAGTGSPKNSLIVGGIALLALLSIFVWQRRWGRYRDRLPWE
jgi:LPXTG-motif cell wall-anchored protein